MEKASRNKIFSSQFSLFKASSLHIKVLVPSLIISCVVVIAFSGFLITVAVLILSTLFLVLFTKKKVFQDENAAPHEEFKCEKEIAEIQQSTESAETNSPQQSEKKGQRQEKPDESLGSPADCDTSNNSATIGNFDLGSEDLNNGRQSEATSESSTLSEEEDEDDSLIEIVLPENESACLIEEQKHKLTVPEVQDLFPESVFGKEDLMELFAETNEEDNLFEIDISVGSIKSPSFHIEE